MEIILQQGEMLVLAGARKGRQVHCTQGLLWVTQAGDQRDHLLHGGDRFTFHLPGEIVVTAWTASRLAAESGRVSGVPVGGRPALPVGFSPVLPKASSLTRHHQSTGPAERLA